MLLYSNVILLLIILSFVWTFESDEKSIAVFLKKYNEEGDELQRNDTLASWKYEIDMTSESKEETVKWSGITSKFATDNRKEAKKLLGGLGTNQIPDSMRRQLNLIKRTASSTSEDDNKEVANLQSKMTSIYSKTVVSVTGN